MSTAQDGWRLQLFLGRGLYLRDNYLGCSAQGAAKQVSTNRRDFRQLCKRPQQIGDALRGGLRHFEDGLSTELLQHLFRDDLVQSRGCQQEVGHILRVKSAYQGLRLLFHKLEEFSTKGVKGQPAVGPNPTAAMLVSTQF